MRDVLTAPLDTFQSCCGLCDIRLPNIVAGYDLSDAWPGVLGASAQDSALTTNLAAGIDYLRTVLNGVARTEGHSCVRWSSGKMELFDLAEDPLPLTNLAGPLHGRAVSEQMERRATELMVRQQNGRVPRTSYRRVVQNVNSLLGNREDEPDGSLLSQPPRRECYRESTSFVK